MTKMLKDLNLPSLQQCLKELQLSLLFKIAEGSVPVIPADAYLELAKIKRTITPKTFDICETQNM